MKVNNSSTGRTERDRVEGVRSDRQSLEERIAASRGDETKSLEKALAKLKRSKRYGRAQRDLLRVSRTGGGVPSDAAAGGGSEQCGGASMAKKGGKKGGKKKGKQGKKGRKK